MGQLSLFVNWQDALCVASNLNCFVYNVLPLNQNRVKLSEEIPLSHHYGYQDVLKMSGIPCRNLTNLKIKIKHKVINV